MEVLLSIDQTAGVLELLSKCDHRWERFDAIATILRRFDLWVDQIDELCTAVAPYVTTTRDIRNFLATAKENPVSFAIMRDSVEDDFAMYIRAFGLIAPGLTAVDIGRVMSAFSLGRVWRALLGDSTVSGAVASFAPAITVIDAEMDIPEGLAHFASLPVDSEILADLARKRPSIFWCLATLNADYFARVPPRLYQQGRKVTLHTVHKHCCGGSSGLANLVISLIL